MRISQGLASCAVALACCAVTHAAPITVSTVLIGNPNNAADDSGRGAVASAYRMGTTEVTNSQYVAFLNAVAATDTYGLYSTSMESSTVGGIIRKGDNPGSYTYEVKTAAQGGTYTYGNKPVVYVSSGDAMRFANWLHNGQPTGTQDSGTTENGAYLLNGATGDVALGAITRTAGATWFVPTYDEWYKAAYYDGSANAYYEYPTGTDGVPNNNLPSNDTGNSANYHSADYTTGNSDYPLTNAGAYAQSKSPYGTSDQGGNVWEWIEDPFDDPNPAFHLVRGGTWDSDASFLAASNTSGEFYPTDEVNTLGFRVASVPEPSTLCLGLLGAVALLRWRRRTS